MTIRKYLGTCRTCGRICPRGTDRCTKHPRKIGRPKGSKNKHLTPNAWQVAQTALADDAYALRYEREQGR